MEGNFELNIPEYTSDEISQKADETLSGYDSGWPIEVDLIVEKKYGLDLIPLNGLKYLSSTDAFLSGDLKEIDYDPDVISYRTRFSIAHELGHYILHKDSIVKLRINSYASWKSTLEEIPNWIWRAAESQANEFAGKLLVPRKLLIQSLVDYKEELGQIHELYNKNKNIVYEYLAIPLSKKFEVSQDVIKIRLMNEKINPFEYI
ncbi:MAG: hypothetical protein COZ80_07875 [Ignavibacteria bacterium CG_4_8_14_3_um_filter_37_9]|nr:MAG: hypothetical protein COZ80_07875 [Ignavibacteria bacterium CG_4_8_14_3_um_filter_37_9]PIX92813.1 MAG: hypothetical protein COZ25_13910 [Ignavibacteria bacterium CG_4_10_14_3_um_filter_37_18]PJC58988.1 MAG: hypothetical protein CO025_07560 [Ignavibacteria bacterium CG_4_9_14_0_2_um_filter_37_13]